MGFILVSKRVPEDYYANVLSLTVCVSRGFIIYTMYVIYIPHYMYICIILFTVYIWDMYRVRTVCNSEGGD